MKHPVFVLLLDNGARRIDIVFYAYAHDCVKFAWNLYQQRAIITPPLLIWRCETLLNIYSLKGWLLYPPTYHINMLAEAESGEFGFGQRKVRSIGGTSHISLPKIWLDNNDLAIGDYVVLILGKDKELVVKPVRE